MDKRTSIFLKIISFFYILQPIGYILLLSIYNKIDPVTVLRSLSISNMTWIIWWVFFISGPIVGFGLLYVTKWGWYAFVIHGGLIVINNSYYLITGTFNFEGIVTLIFLLGGFGLLYFFLNKEVRSPFFNPATRWWDLEGQAKIEMDSLVTFTDQSIDAKIMDISKYGCFLKMEPVYHIGEEVSILIDIEHKLRGKLEGNIVWIARDLKQLPDGLGIKFSKKTDEEKTFIGQIISKLKTLKYEILKKEK